MKPITQLINQLIVFPDACTVGLHPDGDALVVIGDSGEEGLIELPSAEALYPRQEEEEQFTFYEWSYDGEEQLALIRSSMQERGKDAQHVDLNLWEAGSDDDKEPTPNTVRMGVILRDWLNNSNENAWAAKAGGIVAEFQAALKAGKLFRSEDWRWTDSGYVEYPPLTTEWEDRVRISLSADRGELITLRLIHRLCAGGESFFDEP